MTHSIWPTIFRFPPRARSDFASRSLSFWRQESAGAALEFALLAPIMILLIIGLLVVGWTFHCISSVRLALDQSARVLQLNNNLTSAELQALVKSKLVKIADDNVTVTVDLDTQYAGVTVARLTATYQFVFSPPFIPTQTIEFTDTASVVLKVS